MVGPGQLWGMDTFALAPDGRGGFTVRVRYQSGGIVYHLFETEACAVAWIIEHKLQSEANEFKLLCRPDAPSGSPSSS
jgi:hypothetical protein